MRRAAVTPLLRIATWQGYSPIMRQATCSLSKNDTVSSFASSARCQSTIAEAPEIAKPSVTAANPPTETLLKVDWILQNLTPLILKSNVRNFIDICKDDVQFEDRLFKYNLSSRSALMSHIAKVRMYYRYLSPFNKVEWIGSCVYENEDVVVVLWRLTTLQSNFWSYFPSFLTNKEQKMIVKEGALDVHLGQSGHVQKIVNRMMPTRGVSSMSFHVVNCIEKLKKYMIIIIVTCCIFMCCTTDTILEPTRVFIERTNLLARYKNSILCSIVKTEKSGQRSTPCGKKIELPPSRVHERITASDREGAKSLAKLKAEQEAARVKEEEREMRKEFDRQYHS